MAQDNGLGEAFSFSPSGEARDGNVWQRLVDLAPTLSEEDLERLLKAMERVVSLGERGEIDSLNAVLLLTPKGENS